MEKAMEPNHQDILDDIDSLKVTTVESKETSEAAKFFSQISITLLGIILLVVGAAWYDVSAKVNGQKEAIKANTVMRERHAGKEPEVEKRLERIESDIKELKTDMKSILRYVNKVGE